MATAVAVKTMKSAQATGTKGLLEIVEREIPEPGAGEVRIKVQACGVCHSDAVVIEGAWPGIADRRVPGHEVAGIVDAVGSAKTEWRVGSVLAWAGTEAMTAPAESAGAETFGTARIRKSRASVTTAGISSTCWCQQKR